MAAVNRCVVTVVTYKDEPQCIGLCSPTWDDFLGTWMDASNLCSMYHHRRSRNIDGLALPLGTAKHILELYKLSDSAHLVPQSLPGTQLRNRKMRFATSLATTALLLTSLLSAAAASALEKRDTPNCSECTSPTGCPGLCVGGRYVLIFMRHGFLYPDHTLVVAV